MPATSRQWAHRQRLLNQFVTRRHIRGVGLLKVDGVCGAATRKRIRQCKFWLGWNRRNITWTSQFVRALHHPWDWRNTSKGTVARGIARRKRHNAHHWRSYLKPGVTTFDGVRVAKCAVPLLKWARDVGYQGQRWHGRLVSGWRDPAYSEHLCYAMCGAPRCPGKCAGRSSNHAGNSPAQFAIDVSDYYTFGRIIAHCPLKPHIYNALGSQDPVHFSPSGR